MHSYIEHRPNNLTGPGRAVPRWRSTVLCSPRRPLSVQDSHCHRMAERVYWPKVPLKDRS